MNAKGGITGFYTDTGNLGQGFVMREDGSIFTFDAPGASTGAFEGAGRLP